MPRNTTGLLADAQDPRLERLPNYARDLISELAIALDHSEKIRTAVAEAAAEEVTAARALLNSGPEGSDTFLCLLSSAVVDTEEDGMYRPLGPGVSVEFLEQGADRLHGEGFTVRMKDGHLYINGITAMSVHPVHPSALTIKWST
jgi:hypothetical protein